MCNFGSFSGDPWLFACCAPDSISKYCLPSDFNECFPSYNEIKERYYTYCPLINSTMCGTEELDNSLIAKNEAQIFSFDKLRWKDKYYKLPQYDACYYILKNPPYIYRPDAKLLVKFTKMSNVEIYLLAGENQTNAVESV